MKAPKFEYHAPESLEEVVSLLAEHGDEAKVLAGGQSLVPLLAMRLARPTQVVDINRVRDLGGISDGGDHVAFGAIAREREAERSDLVTRKLPVMAQALPLIGHDAIRNRGTIGGSIAHADASGELPTVAVVTGAEVLVRSERGERVVAADDFFVGHFSTSLADDECVVEVRFPTGPAGAGWSFQEVARRHGDFALVGVAAMVAVGDGTIADARVCLMGVADRPVRVAGAEAVLRGATPDDETFTAAAEAAVADLDPASDVHASSAVRRHLAKVTVRRALTEASARSN